MAPAGGREALEAAVRSGCHAVYLGGKTLNARRGAANFTDEELKDAVSWCHVRGVAVYLTLNTLVFEGELPELWQALETACACGVDGIIVQDLAVAALARRYAPGLALHASTQMSIHNADGARLLEDLGFARVVLARELSLEEIARIGESTSLALEVFVHGACCMSVSGQCTLSSMIGGRSGNRGLCAQPCRLPFALGAASHALSLKDMSVAEHIPALCRAGVSALKIEGRLKRPEYVAAAVTACRQALAGEKPQTEDLRAVFSRSGFSDGYLTGRRGAVMFGTRQKDDVTAAAGVLKSLARLYAREHSGCPVDFAFTATPTAVTLQATDDKGHVATATGPAPEQAQKTPTTPERVQAALEKTGETPYFLGNLTCDMADNLMIPASVLNSLRREALDELTRLRGMVPPHSIEREGRLEIPKSRPKPQAKSPALRVRVEQAGQISRALLDTADMVIIPAFELAKADKKMLVPYTEKLAVEIPRIFFDTPELDKALSQAKAMGLTHAVAGNLGGLVCGQRHGFILHGDFGLNITNSIALNALAEQGVADTIISFEADLNRARQINGSIPVGAVAYGYLPLMISRNPPAGIPGSPGTLTDRLGNEFTYRTGRETTELFNMTPLWLADRLREFACFDFLTLYYTEESAAQCAAVLAAYRNPGDPGAMDIPGAAKTRGLYYRDVL